MALDMYPAQRVLEYDEEILDIVDPYLLFFLRWSGKLASLSNGGVPRKVLQSDDQHGRFALPVVRR